MKTRKLLKRIVVVISRITLVDRPFLASRALGPLDALSRQSGAAALWDSSARREFSDRHKANRLKLNSKTKIDDPPDEIAFANLSLLTGRG